MKCVKYLNLFKVHLYYLITKKNFIVILILNIVSVVYILYASCIFDGFQAIDSDREYYKQLYTENTFFYIKVYYVCFISFINISFFSGFYSKYSQYIIRSNKSKIVFLISKYISIIVFDTIELLFLFIVFRLVYSLMPYSQISFEFFRYFFNLYIAGIFYTLLSSLLLILLKTYLAGFVSIILYWLSFASSGSSTVTSFQKIVLCILPNSISDTSYCHFIYGICHVLLLILILIILNTIATAKSDLL